MFAKCITTSDAFLDMPTSARALYLHLGMIADDDGFVNSPKRAMREAGASEEDLNLLLAKRFLLGFDSGIVVIKHWRINNYLQSDRCKPTEYRDEMSMLRIKENRAYTFAEKDASGSTCIQPVSNLYTTCIQPVYNLYTQNSIEENSIEESNKREEHAAPRAHRFAPPTLAEVRAFIEEKGYGVNPERFIAYYESNGWKVGKNPMKDWKAACASWNTREQQNQRKEVDYGNYACLI